MIKVLWDVITSDSTWELEETVRETYPHLFSCKSIFENEIFFLVMRM